MGRAGVRVGLRGEVPDIGLNYSFISYFLQITHI